MRCSALAVTLFHLYCLHQSLSSEDKSSESSSDSELIRAASAATCRSVSMLFSFLLMDSFDNYVSTSDSESLMSIKLAAARSKSTRWRSTSSFLN